MSKVARHVMTSWSGMLHAEHHVGPVRQNDGAERLRGDSGLSVSTTVFGALPERVPELGAKVETWCMAGENEAEVGPDYAQSKSEDIEVAL